MDAETFRLGMRRVSGAVTVVTTRTGEGEQRGLTATAFTSLSTTPPSVLVCVNRDSWVGRVAPETGVFCVNVLSHRQRDVAETFAGHTALSGGARFGIGTWERLTTGAPVLAEALASFDCRLERTIEHATHVILIGTVEASRVGDGRLEPLLYSDGAFTTTAAALPACA